METKTQIREVRKQREGEKETVAADKELGRRTTFIPVPVGGRCHGPTYYILIFDFYGFFADFVTKYFFFHILTILPLLLSMLNPK